MPGGMRPHPEALYYHTAATASQAAEYEGEEFRRKQLVATAMVFSALCLEAFINQEYDWAERRPLRRRWLDLPGLLGAPSTFTETSDPFRTFAHLVETRNNRLVHFHPTGETHVSSTTPDRRYFGDLVGDVELCRRYVGCIGEMIRELHRLTGGRTSVPAFLSGEEYLSTVWSSVTVPYETLGPDRSR
jgi:hypothetical protein